MQQDRENIERKEQEYPVVCTDCVKYAKIKDAKAGATANTHNG